MGICGDCQEDPNVRSLQAKGVGFDHFQDSETRSTLPPETGIEAPTDLSSTGAWDATDGLSPSSSIKAWAEDATAAFESAKQRSEALKIAAMSPSLESESMADSGSGQHSTMASTADSTSHACGTGAIKESCSQASEEEILTDDEEADIPTDDEMLHEPIDTPVSPTRDRTDSDLELDRRAAELEHKSQERARRLGIEQRERHGSIARLSEELTDAELDDRGKEMELKKLERAERQKQLSVELERVLNETTPTSNSTNASKEQIL